MDAADQFANDIKAISELRLGFGQMPFGRSMDTAVPLLTATVPSDASPHVRKAIRQFHIEQVGFTRLPGQGSAPLIEGLTAASACNRVRAVQSKSGQITAHYYGPHLEGMEQGAVLFESGPLRDPRWAELIRRYRWVGLVLLPAYAPDQRATLEALVDGLGVMAKASVITP
ncbi:hypothetical protein OHS33_39000 (plasmid) [Streptomyces sp. NBC_00536]|uniref:hypothetical protein n=1 Tax=Streptomyces sp. NBC_00536 TaxID=2975769 RepID=UPI002E8084AD|nr:hypothetical protein [Streptomyces sp. NBC_00536]WUC84347.1 hypothetical protein OHS33_39000 [Streptomyces sp. NBC_00536]